MHAQQHVKYIYKMFEGDADFEWDSKGMGPSLWESLHWICMK